MTVLWWFAPGALLLYAFLAVFPPRPVGLRPARLGRLALALVGLRLVLVPAGLPVDGVAEGAALALAAALGAALCLGYRVWVVRATREALGEQVRSACRGLFLDCAGEGPGTFVLRHKETAGRLRVVSLSHHWQVLLLPGGASAKVALLVSWLGRQYPGPIPRVRIVLKRE